MLKQAILLLLFTALGFAQRNEKEEAICAPFLTSKETSPLLPHLKRNLGYDEEAEVSCELVLHDAYLPPQIRLTVHEGLYYLAIRHLEMGLHREKTAARHAMLLATIMPTSFRFQYYAGSWAIHHEVFQPEKAAKALYECLYGNASRDTSMDITPQDRYLARKDYIRALVALQRHELALQETKELLTLYPFDLDAGFIYQQHVVGSSSHKQKTDEKDILLYQEQLKELIRSSSAHSNLFTSSCEQTETENSKGPTTIARYTSIISPENFQEHLSARTPFIISSLPNGLKDIDEAFSWQLSRWITAGEDKPDNNDTQQKKQGKNKINFDYLLPKIGSEDDEVLVEMAPLSSDSAAAAAAADTTVNNKVSYGHGFTSSRRMLSFRQLITDDFQGQLTLSNSSKTAADDGDDSRAIKYSYYLNVQEPGAGFNTYRPPLHKLMPDISLSNVNQSSSSSISANANANVSQAAVAADATAESVVVPPTMLDAIRDTLVDVNLWLSKNHNSHSIDDQLLGQPTTSRMHRDANDNLYIVLHGVKEFALYSPCHYQAMETISPSFAINEDGLSHQFQINDFLAFVQRKVAAMEMMTTATC